MSRRWNHRGGRGAVLAGATAAALAVMLPAVARAGVELHDALKPTGVQAAREANLWWLYFWVVVGVFVLVMLVLYIPVLFWSRGGSPKAEEPAIHVESPRERRIQTTFWGAVILTVCILFVLLVADFITERHRHLLAASTDAVDIQVTGHQWWWEVQYSDPTPSNTVVTANEIHIPVGKPVKIELSSADVIHSFWVPNLSGKKDAFPDHSHILWLQADKPGTYYGQCAEFCGFEHALMRIVIIAQSPGEYQEWLESARQPASEPDSAEAKHGKDIFMERQCMMCHTIGGTTAGARLGPPLTHVASRTTIGAGAVPNNIGHLAGWIADPQKVKPGVIMPQNPMSPKDLRDLVAYLESLK